MRDSWNASQLVLVMLAASLVVASPSHSQSTMTYSPLTGSPGATGTKIHTEPHCCPTTALLVKANQPVHENDFQWVTLGARLFSPFCTMVPNRIGSSFIGDIQALTGVSPSPQSVTTLMATSHS
jgi:hypothetical protein